MTLKELRLSLFNGYRVLSAALIIDNIYLETMQALAFKLKTLLKFS